jgi:hypothetical protein
VSQDRGRSEEQVEKYVKRGERKIHTRKKRKVKDMGGPAPQKPTQGEENIINALKDTASFKGIDGGLESSIIELEIQGNLSKL